jgi:alpha-tubulin suppressor-like RCC1 family protein
MEELRQWLPVSEHAGVIAGGEHSFLHLETGEVYACGSNYRGQLGLGDTRDRRTWQRVAVPGAVRAVVLGRENSFLLLETGEVYACGATKHGQSGPRHTHSQDISCDWQRVAVPGAVRAVVTGGLRSFIHLETGEVYACGSHHYGQLGLGDIQSRNTSADWQRVPVPGTVRAIVAGGRHSLLQLETGEVYVCGDNADGQLGLGGTQNRNDWQRVVVPGIVRTIAAGWDHSLLSMESGEVYACGRNRCGELGLGNSQNRTASRKWQRIPVPGPVRTVVAGARHSFLSLETGEVYACGDDDFGQLGLEGNQERDTSRNWQPVTILGAVRTVVAGNYHSLLQLETGEVYACGLNQSGQLGLGDYQEWSTWQLTGP